MAELGDQKEIWTLEIVVYVSQHILVLYSSQSIHLVYCNLVLCVGQYVYPFDGDMLTCNKIDSFKDFAVRSSPQQFAVENSEAIRRAWIDERWSIDHDC